MAPSRLSMNGEIIPEPQREPTCPLPKFLDGETVRVWSTISGQVHPRCEAILSLQPVSPTALYEAAERIVHACDRYWTCLNRPTRATQNQISVDDFDATVRTTRFTTPSLRQDIILIGRHRIFARQFTRSTPPVPPVLPPIPAPTSTPVRDLPPPVPPPAPVITYRETGGVAVLTQLAINMVEFVRNHVSNAALRRAVLETPGWQIQTRTRAERDGIYGDEEFVLLSPNRHGYSFLMQPDGTIVCDLPPHDEDRLPPPRESASSSPSDLGPDFELDRDPSPPRTVRDVRERYSRYEQPTYEAPSLASEEARSIFRLNEKNYQKRELEVPEPEPKKKPKRNIHFDLED